MSHLDIIESNLQKNWQIVKGMLTRIFKWFQAIHTQFYLPHGYNSALIIKQATLNAKKKKILNPTIKD